MSGSGTGTPVSKDSVGLKPADYVTSQSLRLSPARDYRLIRSGAEEASLNLFAAPQGQVLVTTATRVDHFGSTADTLPSLGLPSRMKNCLIYYTCWQLLSQRLAVGQEELKLMSRQTEAGTEDRSEILAGQQTQTEVDAKSQLTGLSKDTTTTEDKAGTQGSQRDSTQTDTKDSTVTGTEDSTTTDDKTPTITGTRDSTTTEVRAALNQEDTNLEQTDDKNATAYSVSTDVTAEDRAGSSTSTTNDVVSEDNISVLDSIAEELVSASKQSSTGQGTTETSKSVKTTDQGSHDKVEPISGKVHTHQFTTGTADWDRATPAVQTGSTQDVVTDVTDTVHTDTDHRTVGIDTDELLDHNTESLDSSVGRDSSKDLTSKTENQTASNSQVTEGSKQDLTSEDNNTTQTGNKTDTSLESNLVLNVQEKTATNAEDNVTTYTEVTTQGTAEDNINVLDKDTLTTTDEDDTSVLTEAIDQTTTENNTIGVLETSDQTTTEDNTITTDQSTDNTTTSVFETTKTTGLESRDTYRDRFQTVQYYKMLLDLEVQSKHMRSWMARGL